MSLHEFTSTCTLDTFVHRWFQVISSAQDACAIADPEGCQAVKREKWLAGGVDVGNCLYEKFLECNMRPTRVSHRKASVNTRPNDISDMIVLKPHCQSIPSVAGIITQVIVALRCNIDPWWTWNFWVWLMPVRFGPLLWFRGSCTVWCCV